MPWNPDIDGPVENHIDSLRVGAEREIATLRAENEQLKTDNVRLIRAEMRKWHDSPAFDTFVELKHGPSGAVLRALQDGEITCGKAAECLAELAHGATEVRIPESQGDTFGEDELPGEVVRALRAELRRRRTLRGWTCWRRRIDELDAAKAKGESK
jgi:hypothetical protein